MPRQPDAIEQRFDPAAEHRVIDRAVIDQGFGDNLARGHARVERGERVLKHQLHITASPAQAFACHVRDVFTVQADGA